MKIAPVGFVCLFVPSLGFADAFAINVLSTQYTTFVSAEYLSYPNGAYVRESAVYEPVRDGFGSPSPRDS